MQMFCNDNDLVYEIYYQKQHRILFLLIYNAFSGTVASAELAFTNFLISPRVEIS